MNVVHGLENGQKIVEILLYCMPLRDFNSIALTVYFISRLQSRRLRENTAISHYSVSKQRAGLQT